ncbi:hypothetical protein GW17_00034904 [Ensete ventricosum]|nr:hypothetical protein GW17_00034904 [Ensete ventricosum]
MTHAIMEVVAGGIVQTAHDINRYVRCTLLNSTKPFQEVVKSAQDSLRWLCHKKFLKWNEDTKLYSTTPLGRAAFGSSLTPEESLVVLDDLLRAREGFVLASDLHLVYLVTPINVEVEPDWELYYERYMELCALDQEVPVSDVCEAFRVARGLLQALQESAGRFALMVSVFCERLGWHDLQGLVAKFQNRVSFGVRAEIAELTTIPHVKVLLLKTSTPNSVVLCTLCYVKYHFHISCFFPSLKRVQEHGHFIRLVCGLLWPLLKHQLLRLLKLCLIVVHGLAKVISCFM